MPTATARKTDSKRKSSNSDGEIIEKSLKRFRITEDHESDIRRESLDDLKFSIGESQWLGAIKAERDAEERPCLTVNRIPTFIRQYTGEERQQRPAMLVDPVGSGADVETANIHQGVLRHIEVASVADIAYDDSYDWMLRAGWAYWRINNEYISDESFDQEPRIAPIENSFSVYMSPMRKPDGTDPLWCHVIEDMSADEYREKYPESKLAKNEKLWSSTGNDAPNWVTRDGRRIAEYWWLELMRKELCLLEDGSTAMRGKLPRAARVIDTRDVVTRTVNCVKHNAMEILERYEWLGKYIPIIPVDGTKLNVNGKLYKAGIVRDAKDPQRLYNIEITGMAEMIALAPKDPLYVAEGSLGNHEEEYRQANRRNYPYLYYKAYDQDGKPLPPPTRSSREPPIQSMAEMVKQADYDLKAVIGIYEPGLGQPKNQAESGIAILTRQKQSDTATVNYSDNLNRSIRYQGKVLLDLWPKLITSARAMRIVNPDDSVKHAVIFNSQADSSSGQDAQLLLTEQMKKAYDVGVGTYDVTLSAGPSYRTARQEAFQALTAVVTAEPNLFTMIGDIWASYADWPGAHALSDRLKKMLPPNMLDADDTDPQARITMLGSQMQQMGQQNNQLVAELSRATDTIRTNRLQIESKERVAGMQSQVQLALQMMKMEGAASLAQVQSIFDGINHRLQLLHESYSVEDEAGQQPATPELPSKVEPKVEPVTPASPVVPVQPVP